MERAGGGWCPKPPVEQGVREWLQVDFGSVHMITGVQTQGRFGHGRGLEYAEEYTLEYWRPGLTEWKPYKRWDGKQVNTKRLTFMYYYDFCCSYRYLKAEIYSRILDLSKFSSG